MNLISLKASLKEGCGVNVLSVPVKGRRVGLNIAVARQRSQMENSQPMVFSMNSIKRRAFNDYLLDLFIDKLGLVGTLIKSHRNFQELRNTGVIRA